jgi:hypothetical protein
MYVRCPPHTLQIFFKCLHNCNKNDNQGIEGSILLVPSISSIGSRVLCIFLE